MKRSEDARAPREDDRALCVAYIDGLLTQDEQLAFEQRLASDPGLAADVRRLLETDELLRDAQREVRRESQRAARRRPIAWIASLAAAAALLAWLATALLRPPSTPQFEVALAPGFEAAREFVASVPTLAGLAPPGLEALRGGETGTNVDAERFVELASAAEARVAEAALAASRSDLAAPFFVLPIRLAAPSEVVVFGLVDGAAPERLYPDAEGAVATLAEGAHLLPSERFEHVGAGSSARVRYRRGFLMPVGAAKLELVIAVREVTAHADRSATALDQALLARDVVALQAALRQADFTTRVLVVRQPN